MDILNYGDCIKNGNYKLHSKFNSVHNYTNDLEIVSLVSAKIGNGPNNVVLNKLPYLAEQTLLVSDHTLTIGNTALQIVQSEPRIEENIIINNKSHLLSTTEILMDEISDKMSPKSLGFLLFPANKIFFQTSFEKAFVFHVKKAVQNISLEELPSIAKNMRGVGFGLTPSGDDFNCGILYALNYLNEIISKDFSEIIEECYLSSIGNNLISNTFLKFACSNNYYENFYGLLKALKQNNKNVISHFTNKIIDSGHTSGSDMLTGFILTLKGVLND
ncbi:MAG: DUF2877 domain-containing protein [Candidatus Cloacimonetes bacterium]|jgi:hypothetical protein|nr:DUF2877 domain-containing protein [Candidatus Cloacimonadota bacterium]